MIHPDDVATYERAALLARALADRLGIGLREFEAKRRPHPGGSLFICYHDEQRLGVVFRFRSRGQWRPEPLAWPIIRHSIIHGLAALSLGPDARRAALLAETSRIEGLARADELLAYRETLSDEL